eukprot:396802-Pyramimonas_sp.AAC.1
MCGLPKHWLGRIHYRQRIRRSTDRLGIKTTRLLKTNQHTFRSTYRKKVEKLRLSVDTGHSGQQPVLWFLQRRLACAAKRLTCAAKRLACAAKRLSLKSRDKHVLTRD